MNLTTHRKTKHAKRKREYLPLAYAIRKSNAAKLFVVMSAMQAISGAIQLATTQQSLNNPFDRVSKALSIIESLKNTGEAICKGAEKLKRVY